jgi:hypothetical protein
MKPIAVVHLVRKRNGLDPLRRFLASYRRFEAGIEHELVLVMKGFGSPAELEPWNELAEDLPHRMVGVPDRGYDITAYWSAAEQLEYPRLFFVNSFSELRAAGWLEKLYRAAERKEVGLVGATGSCQTLNPSPMTYYAAVSRKLRHRGPVKDFLMQLPFVSEMNVLRRKLQMRRHFGEFPNFHVRTNGFMVERDIMRGALRDAVRTKMDAYRFESGYRGLTTQVLEAGMRAIVVGADGNSFEKEEWHQSDTYWQGRQQNLLLADNQTREYEEGSTETREILSTLAWGARARTA